MFTITTIRTDTCDDCHTIGNGVEIVLKHDSGAKAFLCWRHFRMTLEAMRVVSMLPIDGNGAAQHIVDGATTALLGEPRQSVSARPTGTMDARSPCADSKRQNFLHGETKGGTDTRDTGGQG